mmetsp:Transcript_4784/g.9239  ORF Transcript_4784/g.9239 Transcript_4784/m.9239 type:complete len:455 (+) Transcript_4784:35-1399(+)
MSECGHCGEKENFEVLASTRYCGNCGKKVESGGDSGDKGAKEDAPVTSPRAERLKSIRKSINYPTASSHKPSINSSLNTMKAKQQMRDKISKKGSPGVNMLVAGVPSTEVDGNNVYQITSSKLEQIEAAIKEQARFDFQLEATGEQEILEIELNSLRNSSDTLQSENLQLKETLDEVLTELESVTGELNKVKGESLANTSILETELAELRAAQKKVQQTWEAEIKAAEEKGQAKVQQAEADAAMLLESMTSQLEEEKSKFETLKEHAGAKLNAAAQQYLTVQKSDSEKDAQISSLQKQNMQLKSECNAAQAKASEAAATQRRLDTELKQQISEAESTSVKIRSLQQETSSLSAKCTQMEAVNTQYKDQVVQLRGEVRQLKQMLEEVSEELLKSESEKEELQKLSGGGKGPEVNDLVAEIVRLEALVTTKNEENKELMVICDELMAENEGLKNKG